MKRSLTSIPQKISVRQMQLFVACITAVFLFSIASCNKKASLKLRNQDISNVITQMTDIMVHDITSPPLAARFFSYAVLSGYEVVSQNDSKYKSMHGVLNNYPAIPKPDSIRNYNYQLAALLAMMETAKKMQPSGSVLQGYEQHFLDSCSQLGLDEDVIENSKRYALFISRQILAYAKQDGYNKISNLPRYTPL